MACPLGVSNGSWLRTLFNRLITTLAWWLGDWGGWRVPLSVYPPLLRGKTAIVTGANIGLGLETTKALLQQGATVVMVVRSLEHGHTAREDILADRRNHGPVGDAANRLIVKYADYEDFASVKAFADEFHRMNLPLHVLVNNAGVHLKEYKHVDCGFERTIATNYFSHFYLTQLLMDKLKASAPSRVINVASVSELLGPIIYTRSIPWDDLRGRGLTDSGERPYVVAKTYLLMSNTRELARRLEGTGVDVIGVHPGIADSTWYLKSDDAYLFSKIVSRVRSVAPFLGCGQPVGAGAISSIYASIAPELTGITSSIKPHGIIDRLNRALFGGRLVYFGPAYIATLLAGPVNFGNANRCWVANPWCYNPGACKRLYEATLQMVDDVEGELGIKGQGQGVSAASGAAAETSQAGAGSSADGNNCFSSFNNVSSAAATESGSATNLSYGGATTTRGGVSVGSGQGGGGGSDGGLKRRQQQAAAAPGGVEHEEWTTLSAEALPVKGS